MDPRAGLAWEQEDGLFAEVEDLRPTWTVEPDVETITKIVRRQLKVPDDAPCVVKFLTQGAFNKIYTVQCSCIDDPIVRVTLPVQPGLKTLSERATIEYVQHHTDIPIPEVFKYAVQRDSELGFEWMIMERVAGNKLEEQWQHMSWLKKELLVRKVVSYMAQLFRKRFHRLGNIYASGDLQQLPTRDIPDTVLLGAEHSSVTAQFCIGEIVSIPFFYNDHWSLSVLRGPYKHSQHWLAAYLRLTMHDAENMSDFEEDSDSDSALDEKEIPGEVAEHDAEQDTSRDLENEVTNDDDSCAAHPNSESSDGVSDDGEEPVKHYSVEATKARIQRLINFLPRIFPTDETEEYILNHWDLSGNNIIVDETHNISAIIDWECIHTAPLWLACQIPRFLRSRDRDRPPEFAEEFENEWYEKAYFDDLAEYEKTQLRGLFLQEMERVCPEWIQVHKDSDIKADFEFAVAICSTRGYGESIDEWLDSVENGREPGSLRKSLGQC